VELQELLGIDLPILQAPMAGAQGSALAIAVSDAGGLGALPCAMLVGTDALRAELVALRARPERRFNLNFFCHAPPVADTAREAAWRAALRPYFDEFGIDPSDIVSGPARLPFDRATAELIAEFKPPVLSFHFGLPPAELLQFVRGWDAKIVCSATTVAEARWLEGQGVDLIVAQGLEAGGHRGMFLSADLSTQLGTLALVPQIVRAVRVPVVAAGGIADRRGVVAAMALGAVGAQVGTAYLPGPESTISPMHRAALVSEAAEHTALTNLFTGRPARGIVNRFVRELGPISPLAPEFPLAAAAVAPLRARAEAAGSGEFSPLWAGQNARGSKAVPAAQLTRELADAA
jgi:nitronate monooxygenase